MTQFIYNLSEMDVDTDVNPDVNMDEISQNSSPPR